MVCKALLYLRQHHVAYVALFIALGGSAYAASLPRNSGGSSQLKKDAVTSSKVKNGSLRSIDFRASDVPKGGPAGPAGPQGAGGAPGASGAPGERGPSDAYGSFFGDMNPPPNTGAVELARQPLPAGQFIANANFIVRNIAADTAAHSFTCGLYYEGEAGSVTPNNSLDYAQVTLSSGEQQTVSMLGPASQDSAGAITLTCYSGGPTGGGQVEVKDIDIGALRVGALH
jgi:hypothetical protein